MLFSFSIQLRNITQLIVFHDQLSWKSKSNQKTVPTKCTHPLQRARASLSYSRTQYLFLFLNFIFVCISQFLSMCTFLNNPITSDANDIFTLLLQCIFFLFCWWKWKKKLETFFHVQWARWIWIDIRTTLDVVYFLCVCSFCKMSVLALRHVKITQTDK